MAIVSTLAAVGGTAKALGIDFGGIGGSLFGEEWKEANLSPLSASPSQVAAMLQAQPQIADRIRAIARNDRDVGAEIERSIGPLSRMDDIEFLARAALHEAKAPGRDINPGERQIRELLQQGFDAMAQGAGQTYDAAARLNDTDVPMDRTDVSFWDRLQGLADDIVRPDQIEQRARAAVTGAGAGAQAGIQGRQASQGFGDFLRQNATALAIAGGALAFVAVTRNG